MKVEPDGLPMDRERFQRAKRIVLEASELPEDERGGFVERLRREVGEAIEHDRAVLELRRKVLGPDHPHTLFSMSNLGTDYARSDRLELAEPLLREALEARREALGAGHPDVAQSAGNLGWVLTRMERYEQAWGLLNEALQIYRDTLGKDHPRTLGMQDRLAWSLWKGGDTEASRRVYREVLATRDRSLGSGDLETVRIRRNYLEVLREIRGALVEAGRPDEVRAVEQEIDETSLLLAGR